MTATAATPGRPHPKIAYDADEWAQPDDRCSCGRPALVIYLTDTFGRVGFCGIPNARPLPGLRPRPHNQARDDDAAGTSR